MDALEKQLTHQYFLLTILKEKREGEGRLSIP